MTNGSYGNDAPELKYLVFENIAENLPEPALPAQRDR